VRLACAEDTEPLIFKTRESREGVMWVLVPDFWNAFQFQFNWFSACKSEGECRIRMSAAISGEAFFMVGSFVL